MSQVEKEEGEYPSGSHLLSVVFCKAQRCCLQPSPLLAGVFKAILVFSIRAKGWCHWSHFCRSCSHAVGFCKVLSSPIVLPLIRLNVVLISHFLFHWMPFSYLLSLPLSRFIAQVSFCCSRIEWCFAFRWLRAGGLEVAFRGVNQPQYLMDWCSCSSCMECKKWDLIGREGEPQPCLNGWVKVPPATPQPSSELAQCLPERKLLLCT